MTDEFSRDGRMSPLIVACLAITWAVWGSTYLAIKFALWSFPPFFLMASRFMVAGGLLLLWTQFRARKMPTRVQWRNAALVGALMLGGGMGGTAYSEQTVPSGLVVAFIAVVPALIALANLLFGIKPSRLEVIGIGIGIAGTLLLVRGAGFSASPVGLAAIAAASICWSLGSVLSQRRLPLAPGAVGFASEMICGGLCLIILSWLSGERVHGPLLPQAIWAWLYLIVFGSLIAFSAYMMLLTNTSAAIASSYSFVNPVVALVLGIAFGGETVTRYEWMSVGIVVLGVTVLVLGRQVE